MYKEQEEKIIDNIYYCGLGIVLVIFVTAHLILQKNESMLLLLIFLTFIYFIYHGGRIHRIINLIKTRKALRKLNGGKNGRKIYKKTSCN